MYIKVVAKTNTKKEIILEISKDHFEISVKEKAKNNLANKKIIELLMRHFKVAQNRIRIINGHHHPHKLLLIEDIESGQD